MNTDKNEQVNVEEKGTDNKKINNLTYLLPLKILMFIAAVAMVVGAIGSVGYFDQNANIDSYTYKKITKADRKAGSYENSSLFLNDINLMSEYLVSEYLANKSLYDKDTVVFSVAPYDNEVASDDANAKVKLSYEDYNYKKLRDQSGAIDSAIRDNNVDGSRYELLYYEILDYYENRLGEKYFNANGIKYLHLSCNQYQEILDEVLSADNNEEFTSFAESYNGEMIELREQAHAKTYLDKAKKLGVINDVGDCLVIADFSNGTYLSYSYDDVFNQTTDFYIPVDLLDLSSYDALKKSIVTTPFVRNIDTLASFAVTHNENYNTRANHRYYDNGNLSFYAEFKDGNDEMSIGLENADFGESSIVYNPANDTFDENTRKYYTEKQLKDIREALRSLSTDERVKALSNFNNIEFVPNSKAYIKFGFFSYGITLAITFALGFIAFFFLLVMIGIAEKREVISLDRWFVEIKLALLLVLLSGIVLVCKEITCNVTDFNTEWGIILATVFGFAAVVSYTACLGCYLGLVRLAKNKEFFKYVFVVRALKWCVNTVKKANAGIKDIFSNFGLGAKTLGIIVLYGFINCLLTAIFVSMAADDYVWGAGIAFVGFVVILVFNIFFILYKWKEKRAYDRVSEGVDIILSGELDYKIDTKDMPEVVKTLADKVNRIGEGLDKAVAASTKDERLKAELITNVSHDIKTPLTSIINYVDLIKREGINDEPLKGYVDVLDMKSQRLKQLIEDLLEASKASTGNIDIEPVNLNLHEMLSQVCAEYEDKFSEKELELVVNEEEGLTVYADGRRVYRILDNIFQNVYKYALTGTRVYFDAKRDDANVIICLKNVSATALNIDPAELMERFTRGDESRNTDGNGLGLSIASNLTTLQSGTFDIEIDGDLFKIVIALPAGR